MRRVSSPFPCPDCGGEVVWHKLGDEPEAPIRVINLATGGEHDCNPMATAIREQTRSMQEVAAELRQMYRDAQTARRILEESHGYQPPRIRQRSIERQTSQRTPSPVRPGTQRRFKPMQALDG